MSIEFLWIQNSTQKKQIFEEFDPHKSTWLVSDLNAKMEIQKLCLQRFPFLAENSLLRASELWKKLGLMAFPGHRLVSMDFVRMAVGQWLERSEFSWAKTPGTVAHLLNYCTQLLPILTHDMSEELMRDWWLEHPESLMRWGHWYHLSCWLWKQMRQTRWIPSPWLSSWLNLKVGFEYHWHRPLIVDLGSEFSPMEIEIVERLAQKVEVKMIVPDFRDKPKWKSALYGYSTLLERQPNVDSKNKNKNKNKSESESNSNSNSIKNEPPSQWRSAYKKNFKKYSSQLAEIKAAVHQVGCWLSEGVQSDQIVIMAPDIEEHWPTISFYLQREQIPVNKNQVVTLQTFPEISRWLAHLRVELGQGHPADLEMSCYGLNNKIEMPFQEFKYLFTHFFDSQDLNRSDELMKLYSLATNLHQTYNVQEFISWALTRWTENKTSQPLDQVVSALWEEAPQNEKFELTHWLKRMESLCSRLEMKQEKGHPTGIELVNIKAGEWGHGTHVWLLGLTESAFRSSLSNGILPSDVFSLEKDLGFCLSHPDKNKEEFDLEWVLTHSWTEMVLSTHLVDLKGGEQSPLLLWLKYAVEAGENWEKCDVPDLLNWDLEQRDSLSDLINSWEWETERKKQFLSDLSIEWGQQPLESWQLSELKDLSLSASQIEMYLQCPFKVAAQRLLRLSDRPELDLDLHPLDQGSFLHHLFELLVTHKLWEVDESVEIQELAKWIEKARVKSRLVLIDEKLWAPLQKKWMQVAQRFLAFEREWRRNFPRTQTLACELEVKGWWSNHTTRTEDKTEDRIDEGLEAGIEAGMIRGRVDRVDHDGHGNLIIIDYKNSGSQAQNHRSWLRNFKLQLALYTCWLEEGLIQLPHQEKREVISAVYFVIRNMDRHKGFILDEGVEGLVAQGNHHQRMTSREKKELLNEVKKIGLQVIKSFQQGKFGPDPREGKVNCQSCHWKKVCRAPHFL